MVEVTEKMALQEASETYAKYVLHLPCRHRQRYDADRAKRHHVVNGFRHSERGQDLSVAHSRLFVSAVWLISVYRRCKRGMTYGTEV